jgi:hypothetical protein
MYHFDMKKLLLLATIGSLLVQGSFAQLVVEKGAGLYVSRDSELSVAGDININEPVMGEGLLLLNGETVQRINTHGYAIPGIRIDNVGDVELAGDVAVARTLQMVSGKLRCSNFNLSLGANASLQKSESTSWIETDGRGTVRKSVNADIENFLIPLGVGNVYTPVVIRTNGINKGGTIAILSKKGTPRFQPAGINDYLDHHWRIDLSDVEGKIDVRAGYTDGIVKGSESALSAFYREKTATHNDEALLDRSGDMIHATVSGKGGELFAMSRTNPWRKPSLTPNPVRDYGMLRFYADTAGKKELAIIDESGRVVRKQVMNVLAGPNNHAINMQGLAKGYYSVSTSGLGKTFLILKK